MKANVPASVRARLLEQARARREEFERTLVRYADERLLYRLGASPARERCVLKGASLLTAWMPDPYRATRDVDVLAYGASDDAAIREMIGEICAVACPEDGLRFDASDLAIEEIRGGDEYAGRRARFFAYLGAARIRVQMDFGVGDALTSPPQEIAYPTMLNDVPAPRVRAYPREATIAEKFEAMVSLDTRNSRMKDFHDVWALAGAFEFDGAALREAIVACFERRGTRLTAAVPRVLTPAFYLLPELQARWRGYLGAGGVLVAPPTQFEFIGERLITFIGPVRKGVLSGHELVGQWSAHHGWLAPGSQT